MNPHALLYALDFIDSWLGFHAEYDAIPGFTVALQRNGKLVFNKAYGLANIATQEPLTTSHLFNMGSQAKMYTAVAVMQLVEQGKLSLDAPLVTYLPWLAQHRQTDFQKINVRQLLWHGAGLIRDGHNADYWQNIKPFPNQKQLQQLVLESNLVVDRGDTFKYSDIGYALLGEVINTVAGRTYATHVQQHILDPLGLKDTYVDLSPTVRKRASAAYTPVLACKRYRLDLSQARTFAPVAGLYMTTADVCTFLGSFMLDNQLLSKESQRQLLENRHRHWSPGKSDATDYGLGVMFTEVRGRTIAGHSGGFMGYRSASFADAKHNLVVSVAANAKEAPVLDMCFGIFDTLYYFMEHVHGPVRKDLLRYNQRLRNLWAVLQIVATNDRIISVHPDEWYPLSKEAQTLSVVDDSTLHIGHDHDLMSPGEDIRFTWKNRRLTSVNYAGITMVPEQLFARWLAAQKLQ